MRKFLIGLLLLGSISAQAEECTISIKGTMHLSKVQQAAIEAVLLEQKGYKEVVFLTTELGHDTKHLLNVTQFGVYEFQRKEQIALYEGIHPSSSLHSSLVYSDEKALLMRDEAKVIIKLVKKMPSCE